MHAPPSKVNSDTRVPRRCGSWPSPITAEWIASASVSIGQTAVHGGCVYWTEGRPQMGGRQVLVRWHAAGGVDGAAGVRTDVTPETHSVRNRVHEYGGGAYCVSDHGIVYSNDADAGRLYALAHSAPPDTAVPLTKATGARYADLVADASHGRLLAVREQPRKAAEPANELVTIDLTTGVVQVLVTGRDFYASPCLNEQANRLAWLSWQHPQMPWDGCELWLADVAEDGSLVNPRCIAGGVSESIFQPAWSPSGALHFISDRSGYWNLYRLRDDGSAEALLPRAADFGLPQWIFGMSTYGFDAQGRIVCSWLEQGDARLGLLDASTGNFESLDTPFRGVRELRVTGDRVVFCGGLSDAPESVVQIDLQTRAHAVLHRPGIAPHDRRFVSSATAFTFPTSNGATAHAFYYPPTHPECRPEDGERPPLIVITHGGPTGMAQAALKWAVQYWTSRGMAVVDVNYRGSSGYGRAYRQALNGVWGVADTDDAVHAAQHLVARGDVDAQRLAIRGSSAGGYTTLCALTFHQCFKAGASYYGIGDLEALVRDTHKFEARYLDTLIGPYPADAATYRARSPVHHTERLASALILLQGAEDPVVPPAQAEAMYAAVQARGLPVALLVFPGEQHGFRRAEHIRRALEAELYFYGRVFGFAPADAIAPVAMANLPAAGVG